MSAKRNIEEFKIEAVKQVTDRGYKIGETCGKNRVYQVMKEAGIRSQ